jgi:eukaryotic-like serine/threonine-protein kinase
VLYEMLTGEVPFTGDTPVEIAMKHLSDAPRPPSTRRPEIPPDLDMIVLRALAKNPEDRFQSAEEMDAELERVAGGGAVTTITADAATAVLSGASLATAPTAITPPRRPPGAQRTGTYRYAEPPPRRRPFWPWLLALVLLVLAGVAAWYAFDRIQNSLSGSGTVAVPFLEGIKEPNAVREVLERGLEPVVRRQPHATVKVGFVYDQDPDAGVRQDRGSGVEILVSLGPPKVTVPDVKGSSRDEAISTLAGQDLKARPVEVFNEAEEGTVIAQFPLPGQRVRKGSTVRINISQGRRPVSVPSVVGQPYESAASQLQAAGFAVARRDVDDDQPKGIVVAQDPAGGASAARGSTVTLSVSKGPTQSTIPDVTSQDESAAIDALERTGFEVEVTEEDTLDPNADGIVLRQSPAGNTRAPAGTTVTIVVGRLLPVSD